MKTIHNTIRESVRKMSIPGNGTAGVHKTAAANNGLPSGHVTNSYQQPRRPDSLAAIPNVARGGAVAAPVKRQKASLKGDVMRYSMNIEDRVDSILESAAIQPGDFTRSHTLTDLNDVDLQLQPTSGPYASGSQSTLGSDNSRTSAAARLVRTSNDPNNYSSQNIHTDSRQQLGSPVWKPRHSTKPLLSPTAQSHLPSGGGGGAQRPHTKQLNLQQRHSDSSVYSSGGASTSAAYGNYAHVVYDDKNSALLLAHPNTTLGVDDTDC